MNHKILNRDALLPANLIRMRASFYFAAWVGLFANSTAVALQNGSTNNGGDIQQLSGLLYQSTLSCAEKSLRLHETRDARKWLDHSPAEFRGWEWRFLDAQCDESVSSVHLADASVTSLDISPDGKRLAVATATGVVTIYALPGFSVERKIGDHQEAVYSVAFSGDACRLVTVSRDVTARVWDVASGKEISRIKLDNPGVAASCFSPSGEQVATCSWMWVEESGERSVKGVVWIWDAETGEVNFKKHVGVKPLDSMHWSSDGSKIVVGSWDGLVHILDNEANELKTLTVPSEGVYTAVISVAISPDGKLVAAGSKDRTARVWSLEDGKLQSTMSGHDGFVNVVRFTSDARRLVTASVDGTNRIWEVEAGKQLEVLHGHIGSVADIDLTDDDQQLISAGRDSRICSWDLSKTYGGKMAVRVEPEGTYTTIFSPDGSRIYIACYDGHVRVLDSTSGQIVDDWNAHDGSSCNTLSISGDGSLLLTCSWDKTARLWNTADHSLLQTLNAEAGVTHCAISPDGKLAALAVENQVQVWDIETGKKIGTGEGHLESLNDLVFSSDGQFIATSARSEPARIWKAKSAEPVATLGNRPASTVMFSHDGKSIATSEGGQACIWEATNFELLHSIPLGSNSASRLAFSPDDSRLVAGAEAVYVLDPVAGVPLLRFQPNDDTIYYVSFSADGSRLASCTTGGMIAISGKTTLSSTPESNNSDTGSSTGESIDQAAIVFSGRRGDTSNLYSLDLSEGKTSKLTDHQTKGKGHGANNPRLSPDGKHLAFQVVQPGNYDLHVMPVSGGESRPLVADPAYDVSPIWSPQGDKIAFMSTRGFELGSIGPFPGHIYTIDIDGQNLRQVTREPLTSSLGPSDWSADGKTLLMARIHDKQSDIYTLNVETGVENELTSSSNNESSATFSHDGQRIAYHAGTDQGSNIVVCQTDGSNPVVLTSTGFNYYPRWSPDDEWIIFTSTGEGEQCDICAVRVKDKTVVSLVATPEDEREGIWLR